MKNLHNFHILFWLKKTSVKKDETIPIYARIKVDGIPVDISTKESTLEGYWHSDLGRLNPRLKKAKDINEALDDIEDGIKVAFKELKKEGRSITAQAVKLRYLGKDRPVLTINELMRYHRENDLKRLAFGTAKNYGATEAYICRFVKKEFKTKDLYLAQIDYSFVVKFENYLRHCPPLKKSQPLGNNGIMKHLERLQKFTNLALKHEWLNKNPFALYQLKFEEYDGDFLEEFELDALINAEISEKGVSLVRDLFVFACYTGLSYIEVKNLKDKDIVTGVDGAPWIMVRRQKSKTQVKVPLLKRASEILRKYADHPCLDNDYSLLPVYSAQKVNKYIKWTCNKNLDKKIRVIKQHVYVSFLIQILQ